MEDLVIPTDLADALAQDPLAFDHFAAFSDSSKKGILWWIKSAKTEKTRRRRIANTVLLAHHNLRANFPEAQSFDRKAGD